jgi:putative glutamine amidotransferase
MTKPVIGLTAYNGETKQNLPAAILLRAYIAAIIQAGGAPVLIPSELPQDAWRSLYPRLDGLIFTGGGDIAVRHFDGEPHPRVHEVDDERDSLEFGLLSAALRDGRPFLGICRGCQVLNVGLGGTLYTHIQDQRPGALKHDYYPDYPRTKLVHEARVEEGSRLAEIVSEPILQVNSLHHQGIKEIAPALEPVAYAPDGLVEAVELPGHPFALAVQWHPEWLTDQPAMQRLFRAFVEAANGSKK